MERVIEHHTTDSGGGTNSTLNFILGLLVLALLVFLFLYYIVPSIGRTTSAPQVNVPDQVDVNVRPQ